MESTFVGNVLWLVLSSELSSFLRLIFKALMYLQVAAALSRTMEQVGMP